MNYNPFEAFRRKTYEADVKANTNKQVTYSGNIFESFRKSISEADIEPQEVEPSDMDVVLSKSPKLRYALMKTLTSQKDLGPTTDKEIKDIVTDIKVISYRPTTFRIVFKNSNYIDLKYDPTPAMVKSPKDYTPSDYFRAIVLGKTYDLGVNSEYEQCLDQIGIAMKQNPIDTKNPDAQDATTGTDTSEAPPEESETPEEPTGPNPR